LAFLGGRRGGKRAAMLRNAPPRKRNPLCSTIKNASFVYRTKEAFLNDVFRLRGT
jgi:hypothetical protein